MVSSGIQLVYQWFQVVLPVVYSGVSVVSTGIPVVSIGIPVVSNGTFLYQ